MLVRTGPFKEDDQAQPCVLDGCFNYVDADRRRPNRSSSGLL